MNCREKIIKLLETGIELNSHQISKEIDMSYGTVNRYVNELVLSDKIVLIREERYRAVISKIYGMKKK